jgi:hypothetical protein
MAAIAKNSNLQKSQKPCRAFRSRGSRRATASQDRFHRGLLNIGVLPGIHDSLLGKPA